MSDHLVTPFCKKRKEVAEILKVDDSVMSKILRYRNERFTTDKLLHLLAKIYPKHDLVLKVS